MGFRTQRESATRSSALEERASLGRVLGAHGVGMSTLQRSAAGVLHGQVAATRAVALWLALRARFPHSGLWPVLRGNQASDDDLDAKDFVDRLPAVRPGPARKVLAPAFAQRRKQFKERHHVSLATTDTNASLAKKVDGAAVYSISGKPLPEKPWPKRAPAAGMLSFYITRDRTAISFALVPLRHPYEAPIELAFTGGNGCPGPHLISAVFADWQKRYGAVPACITNSVIECYVDRPPRNQASAIDLALEQWLLCEDIVGQGTQSIRNLAQQLWRSHRWFFWWD
jgi:hypothetical protein